MNRTQLLIASQPRPKRRVARPGASSLHYVANPAQAANDHHMGPCDDPAGTPAARTIMASRGQTRGLDEQSIQAVGAESDLLNRDAAVFAMEKMRRCIITDNGREFHRPEIDGLSAALRPKSAEAANMPQRGAV